MYYKKIRDRTARVLEQPEARKYHRLYGAGVDCYNDGQFEEAYGKFDQALAGLVATLGNDDELTVLCRECRDGAFEEWQNQKREKLEVSVPTESDHEKDEQCDKATEDSIHATTDIEV